MLHGYSGNYLDWIHNSRIVNWALDNNIAVILPSGENTFYSDHSEDNQFGKFIGEELIEFTRKVLPLSDKREDTFIGGVSMGGFGALRNGFAYDNVFSKVVALSSRILQTDDPFHDLSESIPVNRSLWTVIQSKSFKDLPEEMDIYKLIEKSTNKPELYLVCGTEDHLYEENQALNKWLEKNKFDHTYIEDKGVHDWDFWNIYLKDAIENFL